MSENEVIQTRTAKFWLRDDGIVHAVDLGRSQVTLEDATENVEAALNVAKGKVRPLFVDVRPVKSVTRDARLYYRDKAAVHSTAAGLLVRSKISKIIANFVIGLDKPGVPAKIFSSETDAIEWLKEFIE